ncbi:MAG: preprotein translocase subunit SecY [Microscillaceae bacterium]|nr:preprotein translocase subunit SecY [Microscillaceae bacterium]
MKKFFEAIRNIFSIEELRRRIIYTVILLMVFRLGSFIVLPGIDPDRLGDITDALGGFGGFIDVLLGGAFSKAAIFALGIMPYISASIVVQLLTVAMPYFQKLQKEGESGRRRINSITRLLTIAITLAQSFGYLYATINRDAVMVNYTFFIISSMVILTTGTMFTMWLGERITERGIGNGISMLIMIGIISRLPQSMVKEATSNNILSFIIELIVLYFVVMAVVMLTQATRKIPVQYAKQQMAGNRGFGGQRQYIPLKVNAAGVMPIIFAQSLMFLPPLLASIPGFRDTTVGLWLGTTFSSYTSVGYNLLLAVLIILFTYFYTAIQIDPNRIKDDIKRNNGFIPGVKPGPQTAEYIARILDRITLPGSIFLAIVAILPSFAVRFGVTEEFAQFYGGTSLLIMVGVILDTLQQINSYLLMRRYEGLMKSGKVRGSSRNIAVAESWQ